MRRAAFILALLLCLPLSAWAKSFFLARGVQGPVGAPFIISITLSGTSFTPGTSSTIGTATVNVSSGMPIPTFSIVATTGCTDYSTHITINSSSGVVSYDGNNTIASGTLCIKDTDAQVGLTNSPFTQAINITSNSPTASLSASPTTIASGSSSTLTWSSTNAASCTGTGFSTGGAPSGSVSTGALTTTTTYSVNCNGATASTTVTVTGGGTVACGIGPSYTGQIPAGAVRAGYNTCAVNLDFTQFTNVNQFIDCFGATTPLLYFDTTNPKQVPCDAAHFAIVPDGGSNSLQMKFLHTEVTTRNINQLFSWKKSGSQALHAYTGWTVPEGYYIEDVWRVAQNYTAMSGNFGGNTVGVYVYGPYFYQPATTSCGAGQGSFFEADMDESFGNGQINSNGPFLTSGNCSGFPSPSSGGYKFGHDSFQLIPTTGCCKYPSPMPNFNNYYTWGLRLTGNGSSSEGDCTYIDAGIVNGSQNAASQVFCQSMTNLPSITTTDGTWTSRVGLFFAALFYGQNNVTSMTGDIAINIKRMTIWSCAAWRDDNSRLDQGSINNECYPGLLTGTP